MKNLVIGFLAFTSFSVFATQIVPGSTLELQEDISVGVNQKTLDFWGVEKKEACQIYFNETQGIRNFRAKQMLKVSKVSYDYKQIRIHFSNNKAISFMLCWGQDSKYVQSALGETFKLTPAKIPVSVERL